MVITSWLSALSSKFFGKKLPPRTRKQPSKQGPQASATSEVLEERTLMTVNPVIDIYTEGVDEDHVFNVNAPGVLSNDPLGVGVRSTIQVTNTAVGSAVLNSDGSFTYDPGASLQSLAAGEYSIQEFTYKVSDVGDFSVGPTEIVRLYVKGLNDATTATGATQTLGFTEDNGAVSLGAMVVDDPDHNEVITATLTLSDGNAGTLSAPGATFSEGVLSISGSKTAVNAALAAVQFTPSDDYDKNFTIAVSIHDGGEDGAEPVTGTITMTATPVGDAPVASDDSFTINEDGSPYSGTLIANDVDTNPAATFTFAIVGTPATKGTVQITDEETGAFTYTPYEDEFGTDTFQYQVTDNLTLTSEIKTITVTINPVNDVPSFTKGADETVDEDSGLLHTVNVWATDISKGPSNESSQTLQFHVSNTNNDLFTVQPSIDASGNLTYTLAANAYGEAVVTVTLSDDGGTANGGQNTSAAQTFNIIVTPINDEPSFTVGATQTSNEDAGLQTVTGFLTNISAGPQENSQAVNFVVVATDPTLFSVQPAISADGTLTYTAAEDKNGSTTVTVYIHDDGGTANGGDDTSSNQTFTINITAVNDAPSFTKGADETVDEDSGLLHTVNNWATDLSAGPSDELQELVFHVSVDNTSLFTSPPFIDADGNLSYTLAANAFGTAVVTVTLSDNGGTANGGHDTSAAQTFNITVTPINDEPSFLVAGIQSSKEDQGPVTEIGFATGISAGPNESSQTVNFVVEATDPTLFSVQPSISADGTLTYTAAPNKSGSTTVSVYIHDDGGTANGGGDTSSTQNFTINITAVNDAPSFTKGADETVDEDSGLLHTVNNWATDISTGPTDESTQEITTFNVTNDNNGLFTVQPAIDSDGNLTYTLAANAHGTAVVTVTLSDNGGTANGGHDTSEPQTFNITVNPVNDEPSFTVGGTQTSNEDAGPQSVPGFISTFSPGPNESSQTVNYVVEASDPTLFSVQPAISADGTLTYTAAENKSGSTTVSVYIHDNGGTSSGGDDSSGTQNFTINITAVNDAPSFTKGADETVNEDSGLLHTVNNWATNISAGPSDESSQDVTFHVSADNTGLFSVQPAIDASGTLTYTLAADAFGTAVVTVTLSDNGGTANSGDDTSEPQTFNITVTGINDAPTFTKGLDQTVYEDSGEHSVSNWATAISAGTGETQELTFHVTNNTNPDLFSVGPAISSDGTLTYTLADNANGTAMVTITLSDDGGTANGGVDTSTSKTFAINVIGVNDAPSFTKGADEEVLEDSGLHTIPGWASSISKGPTSDEDTQSVLFTVTNDNNDLFSVQPAIAANGTLTYTLAPNAFGTATVTVTLTDNGGTSDGGHNTSAPQTFDIQVQSVNDAPSFTMGSNEYVSEDSNSCTHNLITNGGFEGGLTGWTTVGMDLGFQEGDDPSNNFYLQTGTDTPLSSGEGDDFVVSAPPEGSNAAMADQNGPGGSLMYQDFVVPSDVVSATISIQLYINNHAGEFTQPLPLEVEGDGEDYELDNQQARIDILKSTASAESTDPEDVLLTLFQTVPGVTPEFGYSTLTADLTEFLQVHAGETLRLRVATFNTLYYFEVGVDDIQLNVTTPAAHTVAGWATNISAGPGEHQDLSFEVTNDNNNLFSVQPAIDPTTGDLTYTLAPNAVGSATVTVKLHDDGGTSNGGQDVSAPQTFSINVMSVNDAPVFTTPLYDEALEDSGEQTIEGFATGISPGPANESHQNLHFVVTNDNNDLFTVQPSIDPETGDLTYTLAPNAHGNATVTATLYDDVGSSYAGIDHSTRLFTIVVQDVNDVPSFSLPGSPDQTVEEDAGTQTVVGFATNISKGALEPEQALWFDISTSDDSKFEEYPYIDPTTGTLTYKTAANANGDVLITVRLVDSGGTEHGGVDASASQTFTIHITPVADTPTTQDREGIVVFEDGSRHLNVLSTSSDGDGDLLTITIETQPSHGIAFVDDNETPADPSDDQVVYEPDPDYNGTDTFTFKVSDPGGLSAIGTVTMNVIARNDPPTFTVGEDQTVDEDSGAQSVTNFLTNITSGPADETGQTIDFLVENNNNNALFAVQPSIDANGTLTYTPAANQYGTATVTVRGHDDGGDDDTSAPQTFTITINPVNDTPSFTVGGPQLSLEDAGPQTVNGFVTDISSGTNESQTVDFIVTNDNNELFSVQPTIDADGNLTYTAADNAYGTATVSVKIHDDGGTNAGGNDTSAVQTFLIVIAAVNDQPSFTVGDDQTVNEDAGAQTVEDFATNLSVGTNDDPEQELDFIVTNDNNDLFAVQPTINADGTLSYTPAANANGVALVSVYLHDDGGTADGGLDISSLQTFRITITAVNDTPSFTVGADQTSEEDAGPQTVEDFITVFSPGPSNESSQTISYIVTNDNNALFSEQPAISADGTLTYKAAPNKNGTATVTVSIQDNGGGEADTSATQTFTITIEEVFDAPVIDDANFNLAENSAVGTVVGTIVSTDPDVGDSKTFAITSGNSSGTFAINPTTGVITVANNAALDHETNQTLQFVVQVTDGHALIDTCVVIVTITNVAEPTTLDLPSQPNTFYVRHGQTIVDAAGSIVGQESPIDFRGGKLTVQVTGNASSTDRIAIYSQDAGAGKISVSGKDVIYGSTIIGRITQNGNGSAAMIVTFNQNVTTDAVNALLKVVTYKSTSNSPSTAQRTISFRVENAGNTASATDTQLMNISTSRPNRGLTITGGSTAYVSNAAAVVIAPTATITSPAGLDFDGARLSVQITTGSSSRNRMSISNVDGITLVGSDVFFNGNKIGRATLGNNSVSIRLESINATPAAVQALTRAINFSTQGNTSLTNRIATFRLTDVDGTNLTAATQTITVGAPS